MKIRKIKALEIERTVKELCISANTVLRNDVVRAIRKAYREENNGTLAKKMLGILLENARTAEKEKIAICQDTGMVTVFIDMGQDVVVYGGGIKDAINRGVKKAYSETFFRKSVVRDPLIRENTGSNTPAVVHMDIVRGKAFRISVVPKGFGSENKSSLAMLNPTCTSEDIVKFCVETVKRAGPDACPPYVLGIGIGGTMEKCAIIAKKALLRPIGKPNPERHLAELEEGIKKEANMLGIGVMGFGGKNTVLGVNIEKFPTHIAGCPVAVNVSCHALRSASAEI